ncbi:helicase-related protein [Bartonella sp. B35(2025)]
MNFLREWSQEARIPLTSFAVCSDKTIGKKKKVDQAHELFYPATTSADDLVEELFSQHHDEAMTVIFSTYQSIDVIRQAHYHAKKPLPEFDLVICDEAHRTTGCTYFGDEDSNFVRVHDNDYILAKKRLYMTATPRIYGDKAKKRDDVELYSMDDPSWYGETLHTLTFSDAVSLGLLSDYKVMILAVDERHINRTLQSVFADANNSIKLDDAAKIVGCWKALAKYGISKEKTVSSHPMRRAVAFCQVIEPQKETKTHKVSSKLIAKHFQRVVEVYQKQEKHDLLENNPAAKINPVLSMECEVEHVDGSMSAHDKEKLLNWLREPISPNENCCRILTNVRCLSEGVDVPALDAVIFLTPRSSKVDIVQAVGCVMRKAEGKQFGYVILPVVVPEGYDPDKLLRESSYRVVWEVLNALRSHDDRFNATLNQAKFNDYAQDKIEVVAVTDTIHRKSAACRDGLDHGQNSYISSVAAHVGQGVLDLFGEEFERALYAKIVEKCGNKRYWDDWVKDIEKIAQTHVNRIKAILENEKNVKERTTFDTFLKEMRQNINESLGEEEVIEMLGQHLVTRPVFDALFEGDNFSQKNPISQAMQKILEQIDKYGLEKERDTLQKFYDSVRQRVKGIDNIEGKQELIKEFYEKFFQGAFPKMSERLGIAYTPIPVVDFVLHSVEHIFKTEFKSSMAEDNVHIIEPFVGTGTFVTRLLQSGIISEERLPPEV